MKELLRPSIKLEVGDCILEVNRFNKNQYTIFKVYSIEHDLNAMDLEIVDSTVYGQKGRIIASEINAHYLTKNVKWLTYYLPNGRILYGSNNKS